MRKSRLLVMSAILVFSIMATVSCGMPSEDQQTPGENNTDPAVSSTTAPLVQQNPVYLLLKTGPYGTLIPSFIYDDGRSIGIGMMPMQGYAISVAPLPGGSGLYMIGKLFSTNDVLAQNGAISLTETRGTLNNVQSNVQFLNNQVSSLNTQVASLNNQVASLNNQVASQEYTIQQILARLAALEQRCPASP